MCTFVSDIYLEAWMMTDYLKRANDLIKAVRSLRRSGVSVSLPHQTAAGTTFFEIDGAVFTVSQILELFDKKKLDITGIRQFVAKNKADLG